MDRKIIDLHVKPPVLSAECCTTCGGSIEDGFRFFERARVCKSCYVDLADGREKEQKARLGFGDVVAMAITLLGLSLMSVGFIVGCSAFMEAM